MLINRLSLLALAFVGANAAVLSKRQYYDQAHEDALDNACRPSNNETGVYDWNAPCNAVMAIQYECMYGPEYGNYVRHPEDQPPQNDDEDYEGPPEQPFEAQRICICQSQFRDMVAGCMSCLEKAGGIEGDDWFGASKIDPAMQSYCDAAAPAAEDFANFFDKAVGGDDDEMASSAYVSASATASNILGNATDVSLYFTPSVTGSAAYIAGMPTPESSGGNVTYTTSKTSDGQIVPTAVAGDERQASSGDSTSSGSSGSSQSAQSGSATASSDAGAMQTAVVQTGAFGALGLAALIAAL